MTDFTTAPLTPATWRDFSVDDARAAAAVGTRCVLYASGLHSGTALRAEGFPVTRTLKDALATALGPTR
ncbi:hypothetical protein OG946_29460 [Streptomyces sp. NBC_01808]|uniref:hypothetical protein n=1 Tax=Streptomyces sp. NBC_01808 TaxID=2975947 RepID=UPI002DDB984A|nr:hypothetical protein [Streptomyces sp. NBC_01808]WSA41142.1 hypothetical protein OG946_29460 [Streptomyces sp. NBC_01808]